MNVLNILKRALTEEKLPENKTGILLLDIDDTLLKSDSSLLKIYRKLPTDKQEVPLTSEEYAKEHVTSETKKYYDYRDFRDPKKVYASIANGAPLLNNLKVVDAFYNGGYDLGILTARGCADAVRRAIRTFLKVRDEKGNLVSVRIPAANVHCVNDDDYPYPGTTDFEKKQNVLRKYAKEYNYDYVYFIDDDAKNINALKALKKSDPDIADRLRSINAKKNMKNPIKEEVVSEMAWDNSKHKHIVKYGKAVDDDIIDAVNDENFKKAIVLYFDKVKDLADYVGKKDAEGALRHMIAYGLAKTFTAYEKRGLIIDGYTQKMKEWGLKNIKELAKSVSYQGNENYEAPKWAKQTLRKKFMAKSLDEVNKLIADAKQKGYVFKDEPKEGHTAKDGDFYYAYGTINKNVNESKNLSVNNLLLEMARVRKAQVTPEMLEAAKNGDYKKAIASYMDEINKVSEDKISRSNFGAKMYSVLGAFMGYETNEKIPKGTVENMKAFAKANKEDILSTLAPSEAAAPKVETGPMADIRKAINDGDYKKAIIEYFKGVKDTEKYKKNFGDNVEAAYDRMRMYGLLRTFSAEEKNGKIPAGSALKLKQFAETNRKEILADLGTDVNAPTPSSPSTKKTKKTAEPEIDVNAPKVSDMAKIASRISKYQGIIDQIKDYALTSASIKPYIVDIKKNGKEGTDTYAIKQRLSDIDDDNPEHTETERRLAPIKRFRKRYIPEFIQKEVLSDLSAEDKKNLEQAERLGEIYVEATKNALFAKHMIRALNNVVEGFREFKLNNKDASLEELKTEVDFPYKKFIQLEKFFKNAKIDEDEEASKSRRKKTLKENPPEEAQKVRREYIAYLNELDKAIADGKVAEFFMNPTKYSVAYGASEVAINPEGLADNFAKYWELSSFPSLKELSPRLKRKFEERFSENKDPDFEKQYKEFSQKFASLRAKYSVAKRKGDQAAMDEIEPQLEKCAEQVEYIIMDRLIAIDLIMRSHNVAIYADVAKAAERYEKIKAAQLKLHPELKFDRNSPKYRNYYDPEDTTDNIDDMYKVLKTSIDKLPAQIMVDKGLMVPKSINIPEKRYTDDEVKKLYMAYKEGGDNGLYDLLATPEFKKLRPKKS